MEKQGLRGTPERGGDVLKDPDPQPQRAWGGGREIRLQRVKFPPRLPPKIPIYHPSNVPRTQSSNRRTPRASQGPPRSQGRGPG